MNKSNKVTDVEQRPPQKFFKGQFVIRKKDNDLQLIDDATFTDIGWRYAITFTGTHEDHISTGGGSAWTSECEFDHVSDPKTILLIEKYTKTQQLKEFETNARRLKDELSKIEYAVSLINGALDQLQRIQKILEEGK